MDENGVVTFSDRPFGNRHELVVVNTSPPAAAPAASAGRSDAAPEPDATAETGDAEETLSERELAEQRSRNCEIATERAERYSRSRRLYRALPDGDREYLNEEETAAARADAEADVATWCS